MAEPVSGSPRHHPAPSERREQLLAERGSQHPAEADRGRPRHSFTRRRACRVRGARRTSPGGSCLLEVPRAVGERGQRSRGVASWALRAVRPVRRWLPDGALTWPVAPRAPPRQGAPAGHRVDGWGRCSAPRVTSWVSLCRRGHLGSEPLHAVLPRTCR